MVKYKIFQSQGRLKCRHFGNGIKYTFDSEALMRAVINDVLCEDYKIIINNDNLIIKTEDTKVIIENYQSYLAYNLLSYFADKFEKGFLPSSFSKKVDSNLYNKPISKKTTLKGAITKGVISLISIVLTATILDTNESGVMTENDEVEPYFLEEAKVETSVVSDKDTIDNSEEERIKKEALEAAIENEKNLIYKEKIIDFIYKEGITVEQFSQYLTLLVDGNNPFNLGYQNEGEAFLKVCFKPELSYPEKFLMIMIRDGYTYEQVDYTCAGCSAEAADAGTCYDDAYAVASTILNRMHHEYYCVKYGASFYNQITAPGQFAVTVDGSLNKFLGRIDLVGYQAAIDGESMHDYINFNTYNSAVTCSYEEFAPRGNKYMVKLKPEKYVDYAKEELTEDEVRKRVLALDNIVPEV